MLIAADGTYCQGIIKTVYNNGKSGGGVDPAVELKQMQTKQWWSTCTSTGIEAATVSG